MASNDTLAKIRAFAAQSGGRFGFEGTEMAGRRVYILVRPKGGSQLRLLPAEAEAFLSGYVTGRKTL